MNNENSQSQSAGFWQILMEYLKDICYMLAFVVILFTFCIRFVVVSGPSMYATLYDGDYLLVRSGFVRDYKQGDIVVAAMDRFRDGAPIVKRVIATENQTVDIDFDAGVVYVDGVALKEDYTNTPTNLWEGVEFPRVVEPGCLFLMGDNRNDSQDSRSPIIGQVDEREILGKVFFLLFPGTHAGTHALDYGRIGGLAQ